jgi:hypothetical protein
MRVVGTGHAFALTVALAAAPALARGSSSLTGDYVCVYGCRLTDANPSIEIQGDAAACVNEFGGLYLGKLLSETTIACFRKTGTLDFDGVTLTWSDGVIWKRLKPPAR